MTDLAALKPLVLDGLRWSVEGRVFAHTAAAAKYKALFRKAKAGYELVLRYKVGRSLPLPSDVRRGPFGSCRWCRNSENFCEGFRRLQFHDDCIHSRPMRQEGKR